VSVSHIHRCVRGYPGESQEDERTTSEDTALFECVICGKVVRVLRNGKGILNCCGQAMAPKN
jgi:desulfoferrodoxin-like iron-binding protein